MNDVDQLYDFVSSIEALKRLERFRGQYGWKDYPKPVWYESVASHSWRLAMMVMTIAPKLSKPIDLEKTLKMALIHDLPEIIAGDDSPMGDDCTGKNTHAYNDDLAAQKHDREKIAARELFSSLPDDQAQEIYDLWLESEQLETFESQVIKALDKIEGTLQAFQYQNAHMYPEHFEFSITYCMKYADVDPAIRELGESVVRRMKEQYKPYERT